MGIVLRKLNVVDSSMSVFGTYHIKIKRILLGYKYIPQGRSLIIDTGNPLPLIIPIEDGNSFDHSKISMKEKLIPGTRTEKLRVVIVSNNHSGRENEWKNYFPSSVVH